MRGFLNFCLKISKSLERGDYTYLVPPDTSKLYVVFLCRTPNLYVQICCLYPNVQCCNNKLLFKFVCVVSDDDNSDNEEVKKAQACEETVPEIIEKQLTPDELFKDIQEVKDKLKEVRQLLDPASSSRVRYSASEGFLQGHCSPPWKQTMADHTEEIFDCINNDNEGQLISQLKELRAELKHSSNERKTPEGIENKSSMAVYENLSNLAGILESKIEGEKIIKDRRTEDELIERTANEIFNETFENILNPEKKKSEKRNSIKNRIASIETGDWRFSSDEEELEVEHEPQIQSKSPQAQVVAEQFSVSDLRQAWEMNIEHQRCDNPAGNLTSMIMRTEHAFNDVEATFQAAESKMDEALLHTEKVLDHNRQVISSESTVTEEEQADDDDESIISDASKTNSDRTPVTDKSPFEPLSR